MNPTEIIARADRVRQIMESETFQDEVRAFLDTRAHAFLDSQPHEWQEREDLHAQCNAVQAFMAHMEGAVAQGELAKKELNKAYKPEKTARWQFWRRPLLQE